MGVYLSLEFPMSVKEWAWISSHRKWFDVKSHEFILTIMLTLYQSEPCKNVTLSQRFVPDSLCSYIHKLMWDLLLTDRSLNDLFEQYEDFSLFRFSKGNKFLSIIICLHYMTTYPYLIDNLASHYRWHFIEVHYLIFLKHIIVEKIKSLKKWTFLGHLFLKENFSRGQDRPQI